MKHSEVPSGVIRDIFTRSLRIRRFEERVAKLFSQGQLPGFVHLYIGQEAVASGVCAALRDDDYITSTHRGHGHVIAKGGDLNRMMAELFGKATGYCKGKGGSMHIADFSIGMLGACGIVGGGIPVATGAGLSAWYRETDQVSVAFFGDGGANEGSFHESLNLASAMGLPVIYVCENNHYGEFTPVEDAMNIENVADRAVSYGIPGVIVDGTNALDVYQVSVEAVARARRGEGPTLIEAKTHRRGDHAEGEDAFLGGQQYRSEEEKTRAQELDPLRILSEHMVANDIASEADLEEIDAQVKANVEAAEKFARESPEPELSVLSEDTWV